jgi:hypothetical protein
VVPRGWGWPGGSARAVRSSALLTLPTVPPSRPLCPTRGSPPAPDPASPRPVRTSRRTQQCSLPSSFLLRTKDRSPDAPSRRIHALRERCSKPDRIVLPCCGVVADPDRTPRAHSFEPRCARGCRGHRCTVQVQASSMMRTRSLERSRAHESPPAAEDEPRGGGVQAGLSHLATGRRAGQPRFGFVVPGLVFVAVAVFLAMGLGRDPTLVPSPLIGKAVPQFALPPVLGRTAGLSSEDLDGGSRSSTSLPLGASRAATSTPCSWP